MEDETNYHYFVKVAVVGESNVGKSTLVLRHVGTEADVSKLHAPKIESHDNVGIVFKPKIYARNNKVFRVEYWDCPGSSKWRHLTAKLAAGLPAAIFVFDVNDRETFESIRTWIPAVCRANTVVKLLVGNKIDSLPEKREITENEAILLADSFGMKYMETRPRRGNAHPSGIRVPRGHD
mmetsp:Transcript_9884/g.17213  ORF Transcript_9884/g.17213 Transcript_9884/m.17213 type:complete len:179 (-) Transcript_9884:1195-1731(-)